MSSYLTMQAFSRLTPRFSTQIRLVSTKVRQHDQSTIVPYLRNKYEERLAQHAMLARQNHASILSLSPDNLDHLPKTDLNSSKVARIQSDIEHMFGFGLVSSKDVFINNELDLSRVEAYGFDYDYTLASYTDRLSFTIYEMLRDILVEHFRYPKALSDLQFDPSFAIRGLHFDITNGWLMKIDSFANIQLSTVHVGREPIKDVNDVIHQHRGVHISPDYLQKNMYQLNDLFSIPQACLLSDILQYFKENNIDFHPRYLADDVQRASDIVHQWSPLQSRGIGGQLHNRVVRDMSTYLTKQPSMVRYLEDLRRNGKKTFLLSNSSFPFIDAGLQYITSSPDWKDLFDWVIVSSRKPDFYRTERPFRRTSEPTWNAVTEFQPGKVYEGGNLKDFSRFTGVSGSKVIYFGDHVFSDLIDPAQQQGWKTGAIIRELSSEIDTRNTPDYRHTLSWLLRLERLLNEAQAIDGGRHVPGLDALLENWRHERREIRDQLKHVFNKSFGSVFRTHHNPTFFANKIRKFADIYTSAVENMENYPQDYCFYPDRAYLPHERSIETLVDSGRVHQARNLK
ncbi:hypothetical protein INT44_001012 [Umbelopsis vinacea]|uniref:5'-nucleotidase n=1 Tax=Umbelopsis vinacea TaxID=44442 RepID=A0A8H7URG6_9FUNG|nr:hypothetical protein INT44_001012 [Umbelopsis vinacea]